MQPKIALSIAGSDSGGGAGISADLKTFAFHCVHGASALTCVTAQNTCTVVEVLPIPGEMVGAQIQAVATDLEINALKTGMLLSQEIMASVVEQIDRYQLQPWVLDPVMVSRHGSLLIDQEAIAYLKKELLPRALVVTPNRYEAQILSGLEIHNLEQMRLAAVKIKELGAQSVLVKGGGLQGSQQGTDLWFDGQNWETLVSQPILTPHTHGTGCTLSAAITANLARGEDLRSALVKAKAYLSAALTHSLALGHGTGPVGHFYPLITDERQTQ